MILEPTNTISEPGFKEYVKLLKKWTAVSVTKNWIIYLIGKNELSSQIHDIKDSEILVVMERP